MNFTRGQNYLISLDHGNYGGPGYLDLALVHRDTPPSWSSEKGEQHTVAISCNFSGEVHQLDLGNVTDGSFKLEIGYTDVNGAKRV